MPLNRIECPSCGAGLKSTAGFAVGQKIRCPKCQVPFAVEEPADAADDVAPPPPPKPAARPPAAPAKKPVKAVAAVADDNDDEDDRPRKKKRPARDDEDDDRPRKKKKGGYKTSPVRFLILGVLLVALGVLGYMLYDKKQKEKADAAKPAPADTDGDDDLGKPIRTDGKGKKAGGGSSSVAAVRNKLRADELKRVGMGMHNYAAGQNDTLPGNILSPAKKPLLSWRVAILPFVEQQALYKRFKLTEPWDSETNKPLVAEMPKIFASGAGEAGQTHVKVFYGKGAAFEPTRSLNLNRVPDGTSNTIMVAEAGPAVPWTKPEDIPFDPANPLPDLSGPDGSATFLVVMGDASVRVVDRKQVSDKTLKAAVTPAGGEILGSDW